MHNGKEGGAVNNNGRGNQMTLRHALFAISLHSGKEGGGVNNNGRGNK